MFSLTVNDNNLGQYLEIYPYICFPRVIALKIPFNTATVLTMQQTWSNINSSHASLKAQAFHNILIAILSIVKFTTNSDSSPSS